MGAKNVAKNTLPNFNTKLWCLILSCLLYDNKFPPLNVSKTTSLLFPTQSDVVAVV